MAPVMPFYAEYLWLAVKEESEAESVHLGKWPEEGEVDQELLSEMKNTRLVVTFALEKRAKANVKVRQPITSVSGPKLSTEMEAIVLSEVNAKFYNVIQTNSPDGLIVEVEIDTVVTPELIAEGAVRELMRAVQGKRKTDNLEPHDSISLTITTDAAGTEAIEDNKEMLVKTVGASVLEYATVSGELVEAGEYHFEFVIKKL